MIPQRSLPSPACILCVNTRTKGQGRLPDLWDPIQSENAGRKVQLKTMAQERGADTLFFVLFLSCWQGAEPRPFHLIKGSNTEFSSSSKNLDEGLAKIFDEILLQVFSNVPFDETRRTAGQSITTSDMKENHISEAERDDEPPLFNRAVSEQLTTADKKTLQEAVSPGIRNGNLPCAQLLHFLQRNIIIAAVSVAGILVVTVVVLLGLTACMRRKQCLSPPANMTYNIFIMNGKSLWQKSQEKSPTKHAGKQKQLKCNSCV
nr:uncharacterized protein C2orf92 homolog isoform X6 [Equus asinus]